MEEEFKKYIENCRAENLLICFDLMFNRLKEENKISLSSLLANKQIDKHKVEEWIEEFRDLFPKGKNSNGYPFKGDKQSCIKKLKSFFIKHPEYTKEEVLKATKQFVNQFKNNYTYMKLAPYFIDKDGISTLAAICEFNRKTGKDEFDISFEKSI